MWYVCFLAFVDVLDHLEDLRGQRREHHGGLCAAAAGGQGAAGARQALGPGTCARPDLRAHPG